MKLFRILAVCFLFISVRAIPLADFFPYGPTANDQTLHPNDDESSAALPLPTDFPYFNSNQRQIYIANNGLFSFRGPISTYVPQAFPLGNETLLVAGFWSDIDTRPSLIDGNKVYYHIYGPQSNQTLFARASTYVQRYFPATRTFNAKLVIVGTWHKVGAYPNQTSLLNTFQIVLATDGTLSFAFLLYHDIQWINPFNNASMVSGQAGFNAGDETNYEMVLHSRTPAIRLLPNVSNVDVPGLFVFRIDSDRIDLAGCSNESIRLFYPQRGSQLGQTPITIQGPCFNNMTAGAVKCRFGTLSPVDAVVINTLRAICLTPTSPIPSIVPLYLSIDGGATYQRFYNSFTYVSADYGLLSNYISEVTILYIPTSIIYTDTEISLSYFVSENVLQTWSGLSMILDIELNFVQLNMSNQGITILQTFLIKSNISFSQGILDERINLTSYTLTDLQPVYFRIMARDAATNRHYAGFNSPIYILSDGEQSGQAFCRNWFRAQPNPNTWNTNLVPCPMTLAQARVARCCYTTDDSCRQDSWNPSINCGERQARINVTESSAIACFSSTRTNSMRAGAECCYDETEQLINNGRAAGSDDRYSPLIEPVLHFFEDTVPFVACCHLSSNNDHCSDYFQVRPTRAGSNTWNSWGSTWGDPHFTSLDGVSYTFNGYGEYTYLAILNDSNSANTGFNRSTQSFIFESQVRTTPLSSANSNRATIIRGIAAKSNEPFAERVSVTLSRREILIVQRGNETLDLNPISDDPRRVNRSIFLAYPEMIIEFNQTSKVLTLSWLIGVSIQVSQVLVTSIQPNIRVLNIGASVSGTYRGQTFGLLGVYDGNQNNDLQSSNGTVIGTVNSLSLQQIYYGFGQTWLIDPTQSLFYYETGDSANFYANQSSLYVPIFSPINPPANLMNQTITMCNIDPSSNDQSTWTAAQRTCYYDYAVTNDQSLAIASRDAANMTSMIRLAERNPPEFDSNIPTLLQVSQSETVRIDFQATSVSTNNIVYNMVRGPSAATFSTITGRFSWKPNPSTDNNTWIRVSATDEDNNLVSSRELLVQIAGTPSSSSSFYATKFALPLILIITSISFLFH